MFKPIPFALQLAALGICVAMFAGGGHSTTQDPIDPPTITPEPAVSDSDDSTEAKLSRAVKNCIVANENYVKSQAEIKELKSQLAERKQAANYWYAKSKSRQTKPAVQLDYSFSSGNCANGQCGRSGRRGRR